MSAPSTALAGPGELEWGQTWPELGEFRELARRHRVVPVVRRIFADDVTPVGLYRQLTGGRDGSFVLESAASDGVWSRWSFIGVRSRAILVSQGGVARWTGDVPAGIPLTGPVLEVLEVALEELKTPRWSGLPPLTGGLVGVMGWDVVREWEPTLPALAPREIDVPDVALALASDLAALDHRDGSLWLIANAINFDGSGDGVDAAHADAVARLDAMSADLLAPVTTHALVRDPSAVTPELRFRTSQEEFEAMVLTAKDAIRDGEVFQVVLSLRLDLDCPADPLEVYRALRTVNPSPYMYLLRLSGAGAEGQESFAVVGSSPETLVKVSGDHVETFPIAGSRPRGSHAAQDTALSEELLADPKERAEHLMLVDLARNDLVKVCDPATVRVVAFMEVHRYSHIMHLSSTVTGRLRPGATALDVFTAAFPAGTLSGAPKPRAIALIDELEPARRGVYGGTVGYFDFAGDMDMAIAIRTACIRNGVASVQAGAGLVADSVPATEYIESRNKAAAAVRAVQLAASLTAPAAT